MRRHLSQETRGTLGSLSCLHCWLILGIVLERTDSIHAAIRILPRNIELSNPKTSFQLPFPSILPAPGSRFEVNAINNVNYFRFIGRSRFSDLESETRSSSFAKTRSTNLYLYGPPGSGKSHALAALAVKLIQDGKSVVFIPHCLDLISNFEDTIRTALCFAFHNDPTASLAIDTARGVEELLELSQKYKDKYILIDHLDALDTHYTDPQKVIKSQVRMQLELLSGRHHRCIYCASVNSLRIQELDSTNPRITKILLQSGMDEVRSMF
jgi:Cdc6-like AAA superfamily ATPase